MKICITSSGRSLDSLMSPRFGRCPFLLVVDTERQKADAIENKNASAARGAGVATAQTVSDQGCKIVITGNIGPHAFSVLNAAGIKVFITEALAKTCEETLRDYNNGKLSEASAPTGRGFGRGRGRGWRRGRKN